VSIYIYIYTIYIYSHTTSIYMYIYINTHTLLVYIYVYIYTHTLLVYIYSHTTSPNQTNFTNSANKILQDINKWFTTNLLSLNADKIQYMQFVTKTSSLIDLYVMYKNKEIVNTSNTKFLGQTLDNTFSWNNHIDAIVPKLSSGCFTVRAVSHFYAKNL
jgi:hypothetical protein